MWKNVDNMAEGVEMTAKLLDNAKDLKDNAQQFAKNSDKIDDAARKASFWACSYPCIVMTTIVFILIVYFVFIR